VKWSARVRRDRVRLLRHSGAAPSVGERRTDSQTASVALSVTPSPSPHLLTWIPPAPQMKRPARASAKGSTSVVGMSARTAALATSRPTVARCSRCLTRSSSCSRPEPVPPRQASASALPRARRTATATATRTEAATVTEAVTGTEGVTGGAARLAAAAHPEAVDRLRGVALRLAAAGQTAHTPTPLSLC
jgi:hypothetical protein